VILTEARWRAFSDDDFMLFKPIMERLQKFFAPGDNIPTTKTNHERYLGGTHLRPRDWRLN